MDHDLARRALNKFSVCVDMQRYLRGAKNRVLLILIDATLSTLLGSIWPR